MAQLYDRLINYINSNIPLLGEPIDILGEGSSFTATEIIIPIVFLFLVNLIGNLVRATLINKILPRYVHDRKTVLSIGNTTKYTLLIIGVAFLLTAIGLNEDSDLNYPFTKDKDGLPDLTLFDIARLIFFMTLLVFLSGKLKTIFVKQILSKYSDDIGVSQSIGTIIQYFLIIVGAFVVIQNSGINLGSLNVLAGALGVGIGFGLQNIANNFISGLIILFERPIKVGDRIEVGSVSGDVVKISSRASTVNTNDNISIIIPNSDLINKQVINWSHNDRRIRYHVPVGVSYKEDPAVIKKVLLEVADANKDILKRPAPDVLFVGYGDSSIDFDLLIWTSTYIDKPIILKSQLYYEIFEKFKEHKIEIPYPQRDLHLKSGWTNTGKGQK
ncbi:mechanosensitive ion channel family protein [Roseivirga sp. E12]|uniref:mechanosensitive ion channel family protein n=1 Tax=Roseivirga sp. E12 TaxID=2819237 RepID=UPI001ABC7515|nr:mechanosensitive ion channel domain-containing protein [Roseivirga sp. E12]MBO3700573.1 mechanosensitive ion channel [Roseivirga sp. E12]